MSSPTPPPPPPATPAGWYPNGPVQRYWNGAAWTEHTAPLPSASTGSSSPAPAPAYAVTTGPRPFNHGLHLVLTVCTCGLWLPFWILLALGHASKRKKSVTRFQ